MERHADARRAECVSNYGQRLNDNVETFEENEILEHLEEIERTWSDKEDKCATIIKDCLQNATNSGLIPNYRLSPSHVDLTSLAMHRLRTDNTMEQIWQQEYGKRCNAWKCNKDVREAPIRALPTNAPASMSASIQNSNNLNGTNEPFSLSTNDDRHSDANHATVSFQNPNVFVSEQTITNIEPDEVASHWSLNAKQKIAYHLIVNQCIHPTSEPLSMIITGAAGTGKSRIIRAAQDFFTCRNEGQRFRLASFTGIVAQNIEGVTLHSALALSAFSGERLASTTRNTLIRMWQNVDILFIDEYSMIGCRFLYKIHLALTMAKECSKPFGGVNIIFAGDFCQLPAVGETRLYAKFNNGQRSESKNLHAIYGRLLWLSIPNVIILQSVERQRGSGSTELILLLSRLCKGNCTAVDYEFLSTRLAPTLSQKTDMSSWQDAPIIVSENATKDALNVAATEAFAHRTGRHLYWYHCIDTHNGDIIHDHDLNQHLQSLASNTTGHRLGHYWYAGHGDDKF